MVHAYVGTAVFTRFGFEMKHYWRTYVPMKAEIES